MYKNVYKPVLDRLFAGVLLVSLAPLIIAIVLVQWMMGQGIFFIQRRPGKNEQIFNLYKFRTLKGTNSTQEIPLNGFAQLLRRTSLDELPQLFNILKGEMSFIGPRPLLEEYLGLYSEYHSKRHSVLPGLTGLAQVNGRNNTTWNDRLDLDCEYVHNLTFGLDWRIFIKTIALLFLKSHKGSTVTLPRFEGYSRN